VKDGPTDAVLLMAYGAPATLDDVAGTFTHICGGRRPAEERIEALKERYRLIGEVGGLLRITEEQGRSLQRALDGDGGSPVRVLTGMRHSPPFIKDRARDLLREGARRLVGLVLAPHYSAMSVGAYHRVLREALAGHDPLPEVLAVDQYHDDQGFIAAVTEALNETLAEAGSDAASAPVIFTAHSLPERILSEGDPYTDQIESTARLVAGAAGVGRWEIAFQSASSTAEPWLGPDFLDRIRSLGREGCKALIVCPVGFVSDHLEILHDVDIVARKTAQEAGSRLWRTPSMNSRPAFISALASIVRRRLAGSPA
jgi:ferrochelatase